MRIPRGLDALLPAGTLAAVAAVLAALLLPADTANPIIVLVDLVLIAALTYLFHRTGRVPGLARPAARFWAGLSYALGAYSLGMAVDFTALLVTAVTGREIPMYGAQIVYPLAGLVILYAVFRYPTTTQSRSERLRVGLDVGIVLLGAASFIWYFTVSPRWTPGDNLLWLSDALALPVMVLVAGFGVLRVAFAGAKLLERRTLACFLVCIVVSGFATAVPGSRDRVPMASTVLLLLAQLVSIVGALIQLRATTGGEVRAERRSRRTVSLLPYGASAAAFGLLIIVVAPDLDWRRWGVLVAVGAVMLLVTVRQLAAMRENDQLLAANRVLTEKLRHQAWHDELTGLGNRAQFIHRIAGSGGDTAVLLLDLDGFKAVNDTLGHDAGDRLLCEVASRITGEAGDATVFRLGGDEFVVLAARPADDIARLADRLVAAIAEPAVLDGREVRVGASIGITFVGDAGPEAAELLRRADAAMYAVKSAGKNNWRVSAGA
ncbi:GGDEF domain-containing protein [Actinoplanes bogorensis]|uniref:GGDEF domain-containing protein n=1 Tax=Paractinoplanes bogorensis TaxID=1610840 RepID=A0ABS5Z0C3_9ACTN|nr:GGDEF domain-containing protein [Actinoplanes bogorensis]MBU2669098.1 GGDEF domain-containing protein [Actinoplanes bogorensis]